MKMLIVDDEKEILKMLKRNFDLEGYEVTVTDSPIEAMQLMKEHLFNLVLSDIKMPGMSGIELLSEIKKYNPLTNVIMMTGYSSMSSVVECLEAGATDYFVKPFRDLEIMIEAVNLAKSRIERWRSSMGMKE